MRPLIILLMCGLVLFGCITTYEDEPSGLFPESQEYTDALYRVENCTEGYEEKFTCEERYYLFGECDVGLRIYVFQPAIIPVEHYALMSEMGEDYYEHVEKGLGVGELSTYGEDTVNGEYLVFMRGDVEGRIFSTGCTKEELFAIASVVDDNIQKLSS